MTADDVDEIAAGLDESGDALVRATIPLTGSPRSLIAENTTPDGRVPPEDVGPLRAWAATLRVIADKLDAEVTARS